VERALRALVGLLIIEMLVAHRSALATDHPYIRTRAAARSP
jgi:hypothetical protein